LCKQTCVLESYKLGSYIVLLNQIVKLKDNGIKDIFIDKYII